MTDDQQPPETQTREPLPREHLDKLVTAWSSGFVSGMTTQLVQGHTCSDPSCPVPTLAQMRAQAFIALSLSDPAFRLSIEQSAEDKWHDPDIEIGMQSLSAYPASWNGGQK